MKRFIIRIVTLTRLAIQRGVIMSISFALFLLGACEQNPPTSHQDSNGLLQGSAMLCKQVVSLDAHSSFAAQVPFASGLINGFAILSYAGITDTGAASITGNNGASPITGSSVLFPLVGPISSLH